MTARSRARTKWRSAVLLIGFCVGFPVLSAAQEGVPDDVLLGDTPHAEDPEKFFRITAGTGFDFSTGDFDTGTDSEAWYLPTSIKVEWDMLFAKLTIPYVFVDGDVVVIDGVPQGASAFTGKRNGIGDVVLAAGGGYYPIEGILPAAELTGKVKFATANEDKGLGTGEVDYSIQFDTWKQFGPVTPFATAGYTFYGDPPDVNLKNRAYVSGGAVLSLGKIGGPAFDRFSVGLVYDWAQSSIGGRRDIQALSPFATIKLGRHFAVDPYAAIGLTSTAPDWGVGMQIRAFWEPFE